MFKKLNPQSISTEIKSKLPNFTWHTCALWLLNYPPCIPQARRQWSRTHFHPCINLWNVLKVRKSFQNARGVHQFRIIPHILHLMHSWATSSSSFSFFYFLEKGTAIGFSSSKVTIAHFWEFPFTTTPLANKMALWRLVPYYQGAGNYYGFALGLYRVVEWSEKPSLACFGSCYPAVTH